MPHGETLAITSADQFATGGAKFCAISQMIEQFSSAVSADGDEEMESSSGVEKLAKEPRKVARKYQLDLCKKALEENIIVYLGTGCGKTHIAVLLIDELGHLIRKPQNKICVFLAPTVALVQQQAKVVEDSIDFKVGVYCGSSKHLNNKNAWETELQQYEVLVMTPQILLRNLSHCFIPIDSIELLIFDECHHAQIQSNHPYAQIMKVFYKTNASKLPRIFGMTASPIVGKDASNQSHLQKRINSLEKLLDAKVYSVVDQKELESYVASPVVKVYDYGPVIGSTSSLHMKFCGRLGDMKHQYISTLSTKVVDYQSILNTKKLLNRIHDNLIFCLENLGLWGAMQACKFLLGGDSTERNELVGAEGNCDDDSLCDRYLAQVTEYFSSDSVADGHASDISNTEVLKEPFFSKKLLCLIGILSNFRLQPNMKCIIFVNRVVIARSLSYILQSLKFLASWKCGFLVGVHTALKSMSRKNMNLILEKFRYGELNLLVATKVGEEGLDIQTCCLVIRFDLPETVASFIQSRGRARMPQSEYVFLVDSGNRKDLDLIENFRKDEKQMNLEISFRTSSETLFSDEERVFRVDASGAAITSGYSISLLHQYCAKLPHDEYFDPKPKFFYFDDPGGILCHIILPSNAPIHKIVSTPQSSKKTAKKEACLIAIEELHKQGALNVYLLPMKDDANKEELVLVSSDSNSSEDEDSRRELHEMLVPAALKEPWTNLENHVYLNSYCIKFNPQPADRIYKNFGLFVKAPLPVEAEGMELDLHLARGRSVLTKFVPSGAVEFDKDEIIQAQKFQEMFLKIILDRSEFMSEFVPLGKNDLCKSSSSTFYLLLPVIFHDYENIVTVDWKVIRKCLSSPLFTTPADAIEKRIPPKDNHLQLANGCKSISLVKNSLVYVPHKKKSNFFFITDIFHEKNAYSPHKRLGGTNYVEHFLEKHSIDLKYPEQPLLHAKPLFYLHNLLCDRKKLNSEPHELEEYFIDLPPELCQLKIVGFSKDTGSSLSLLPSIMHRLENLLVAIELRSLLSAAFPEGAEVTAQRVLEAITTEKCMERFSLERLEILGDAFLKFAVGRSVFLLNDTLDEGGLTRKRVNLVNNSNLFKLAKRSNLQVYIRDQSFDPKEFYALGHPCPNVCNKETERTLHSQYKISDTDGAVADEVRCSKGHHLLYKKTIADVVEALVGAFIVDSGFKAAIAFLRWIGIHVDFEAAQVYNICISSSIYMPLAAHLDIATLENIIGYQFINKGLLLQAFVHPSYNNHGGGCYQRLEFLGDAVLDYLITSYIYSVYPKLKPGQLTDLRSSAVSNYALARVAVDRSFHKYLLCDSSNLSEAITTYVDFIKIPASGRGLLEGPKCPKALGDLVESCLGAILLDSGFNLNLVWNIMLSFLDPTTNFSSLQFDPIREVQEFCQSHKLVRQSETSKDGGTYLVESKVNGNGFCATASARSISKKDATKIAANRIVSKLKAQGYTPKAKSLERVLKSSDKMEAKLIGYNETPTDVNALNMNEFKNSLVLESSGSNFNPKRQSIEETDISTLCNSPVNKQSKSMCKAVVDELNGIIEDQDCITDLQAKGRPIRGSSRSHLYEICAANCWKPPYFECCKEEGPGHMKLFTCKVIVEIEEAPNVILECFGAPNSKKKASAEHAADGAIWYLKCKDYTQKSD